MKNLVDIPVSVAIVVPLACAICGCVLVWIANYRGGERVEKARSLAVTKWLGVALTSVGAVTFLMVSMQFLAVLFIPFAAIGVVVVRRSFRRTETQSLLWILAAASERGIPLEAAARAFAQQHTGTTQARALLLAEYLACGVNLSRSLQRSGLEVDVEAALAADLGPHFHAPADCLREAITRKQIVNKGTQAMSGWLVYFSTVSVVIVGFLAFMGLKIVPVFEKMFREFGVPPDTLSQRLLPFAYSDSGQWLLVGFGLFSAAGFALAIAMGNESTPRRWPFLRWIWWRVDRSLVLQWLAAGVRHGKPIGQILRMLAATMPMTGVAHRLSRAATQIEQGANWRDALRRERVLRGIHASLFDCAERAGNLPWALEQVADSEMRRWKLRMHAFEQIAIPIGLGLLASIVLFCGVLLHSSLAEIIEALL